MNFPTWNPGAFVSNYSLLFLPERRFKKDVCVIYCVQADFSILSGTQWASENTSWIYGYRNGGWHGRNTRTQVSSTHIFLNMYKTETRTDGRSRRHRNTDKTWWETQTQAVTNSNEWQDLNFTPIRVLKTAETEWFRPKNGNHDSKVQSWDFLLVTKHN